MQPQKGGSDGMKERRKSVVQFAVRGLDSSTTEGKAKALAAARELD